MAYRSRRGYNSRSYGAERAAQHIAEARSLSRELGGTDQDVKQYFFSLPPSTLNHVLDLYEQKHGSSARQYAQATMGAWKSGRRQMSGMVASRLYNMLPPIMPLDDKYKLVESLWKAYGPKSNQGFVIGPDAVETEIVETVRGHFDEVVQAYTVPEQLKNRFNWLAQGDVSVQEKLLNHFMHIDRVMMVQALHQRAGIFLNQIRSNGTNTQKLSQEIVVGNHKIVLNFSAKAKGIAKGSLPSDSSTEVYMWIFCAIAVAVALYFFFG